MKKDSMYRFYEKRIAEAKDVEELDYIMKQLTDEYLVSDYEKYDTLADILGDREMEILGL